MRPADEIERLLNGLQDHASASFDQRTLGAMFSALDKSISETPARSWQDLGRAIMRSRITKLAAAAVLGLAVLLLARHLTGRERSVMPETNNPIVQVPDNQEVPAPVVTVQEREQARLAQELASAKESFAAADVNGLLRLLDSGLDQTKIATAGYLARMGEVSAIPVLQKLASQWQGPAAENPFQGPIEQIRNAAAEKAKTTPQSQSQEQPGPGGIAAVPGSPHIVVRVTDKATGEPIPQARIEVDMAGQSRTHAANDEGVFILDLGASIPDFILIRVPREGYVLQGVTLRGLSREMLPKTIRFSLEKGVTIGGVVQDGDGRPVEGATVEADFTEQKLSYDPWFSIHIEEKTDAQGRWQVANVPGEIDSLWFAVRHPEFAEGGFGMPGDLEFEDLQAQRAVMVLNAGIRVAGCVNDVAGNPIAGADLLVGQDYHSRDWAKTDMAGCFEFPHLRTINQSFLLTVQAKGFASQRREVPSEKGLAPIAFVLQPAKILLGRVVDSTGQPVENASIVAEEWNDYRTIKWQAQTDPKGMFLWDYPPADAILIRIVKTGYRESRQQVVANDLEQTFVLAKPMIIRGTVTDSQTGEPVSRFKVTPGIQWNNGGSLHAWQTTESWVQWFTDGRYSYTFSADGLAYAVRIEADGYMPAESAFVDANRQEVTIDIALSKGQGPSGYVFDVNGVPVVGAEVFWENNRGVPEWPVRDRMHRVNAKTDRKGYFTFKPENRKDPFIVLCDRGMGVVSYEDLMRDGSVALMPWARVQGDLRIGTRPAIDTRLQLIRHEPRLGGTGARVYTTSTDENGRFLFQRVYPGQFTLYDHVYEVAPGQTLELHLGGTGRTVKGELAIPGAPDITIRSDLLLVRADERSPLEAYPWPAGHEQMSFGELREWLRQFAESPEGKAYAASVGEMSRQKQRSYRVELDDRRMFHADNVEPGAYFLWGDILRSGGVEVIARVWQQFEVPPFTNVGELDVPLDLGMLAVLPGDLKPGDPAPDFDAPASAAGRIRLTDYRGKVLLMTFLNWSFVDPNSKDLLDLKAVYQRFHENPRYAQVSLQSAWYPLLDSKAVEAAGLDWPHGLLEGTGAKESMAYGLKNMPWNVLIGPQGQIIAVGLSGEALVQSIEEVLQTAR